MFSYSIGCGLLFLFKYFYTPTLFILNFFQMAIAEGVADFLELAAHLGSLANEVGSDINVIYDESKKLYERLRQLGDSIYDKLPGKHLYLPVDNYELALSHIWVTSGEAAAIISLALQQDVSSAAGRRSALSILSSFSNTKTALPRDRQISNQFTYVAMTVEPFRPYWVTLNILLMRPKTMTDAEVSKWYIDYNSTIAIIMKNLKTPFRVIDIQSMFDFAWHKL